MRTVFALVLAIGYPLLGLWQIDRRKLRDRLDVVLILAAEILFLLLARTIVDWQETPPWLWLIGLVLLAAGVAAAGWAWPDLNWTNARRHGRHGHRAISVTIQLAIAAALVAILF
jgi:hypothetical protein